MRYLDLLRTLEENGESSQMPGSPTVETVETPSKPSIDGLDSLPSGDFQKITLPDAAASCPPEMTEADADASAALLHPDPTATGPHWHGLTAGELMAAAGPDWPTVEGDADALDALALALLTRRQRDRGERPEHYTQPARCDACGPVWLWRGAPARVRACPWCFNRAAGKPVPSTPPAAVTCGTCGLFAADPNTPAAGFGRCGVNSPASQRPPALCPGAAHICPDWRPLPDEYTAT